MKQTSKQANKQTNHRLSSDRPCWDAFSRAVQLLKPVPLNGGCTSISICGVKSELAQHCSGREFSRLVAYQMEERQQPSFDADSCDSLTAIEFQTTQPQTKKNKKNSHKRKKQNKNSRDAGPTTSHKSIVSINHKPQAMLCCADLRVNRNP